MQKPIMNRKLWRIWNQLYALGKGWHPLSELEKYDGRDITELDLRGALEYSGSGTWRLLDLQKFKNLNSKVAQ